LHEVLRPKLAALNLDRLLEQEPLDFFILFSSIGSLVGLPGQAAYAAANAFLDGLAASRKARGRPALAVNWGAFFGAGLARTAGGRRAGEHLTRIGLPPLEPASTIRLLDAFAADGPSQAAVFALDAARHRDSGTLSSSILRDLVHPPERCADENPPSSIAGQLAQLAPDQRRSALENHVRTVLGSVLEMSPDRVEPRRPLASYGIDSRMSIELRNRLESSLQLRLSATIAWNYPTLDALTLYLLRTMNLESPPADNPARQPVRPRQAGGLLARTLAKVEALSDEEAAQALDGTR
jgi:acyl carrier protein